jgi:ABC-type glycerol-3-phosphate transport system permease component
MTAWVRTRRARPSGPTQQRSLLRTAGTALLWFWVAISMIPFIFMLVTSIKPEGLTRALPPVWIFEPTLEHYQHVIEGGSGLSQGFDALLRNSVIVTLGSTILTVLISVPAAYALAQRTFRRRRGISMWVLSTYMFPPMVAVIPIFILVGMLGFSDTYPALIVPYAAFNLPIAIWVLRASILAIPYSLQEAAMLDGASQWTILRRVVGPLLVPSIATVAILSAILSWNEFLFALALARSDVATAPVGIQQFTGMFGTEWGSLTAAGTIVIAPILVLTLVLRRRLVSGLTLGAVR